MTTSRATLPIPLVAGELEAVARIIDPEAWQIRDTWIGETPETIAQMERGRVAVGTGDVPSEADTRAFVWRCIGDGVVTPDQVEIAVRQIRRSFAFLCKHTGWTFDKHGRGCPHCGRIVADFGD